jgi:hypothetical protein
VFPFEAKVVQEHSNGEKVEKQALFVAFRIPRNAQQVIEDPVRVHLVPIPLKRIHLLFNQPSNLIRKIAQIFLPIALLRIKSAMTFLECEYQFMQIAIHVL